MTRLHRFITVALLIVTLLIVTLSVPLAGVTPAHAELVWVGPAAHVSPAASWAGCSYDTSGCPK